MGIIIAVLFALLVNVVAGAAENMGYRKGYCAAVGGTYTRGIEIDGKTVYCVAGTTPIDVPEKAP